ncbi:unnamed protein product [Prorocentrum cordatum]|uniref:Uncharacterized protein n=1 Tax=Prorocentrum cordatum TaxID=2364126 RepID=A0ABN9UQ97_9DINO|nr:unnamed protein product [Polarella glacialis]
MAAPAQLAKRAELFMEFTKARLQFITCNIHGGMEIMSHRHTTMSRTATSAVLRQLESITALPIHVASELVEVLTGPALDILVEADRRALVAGINGKTDLDGTGAGQVVKDDEKKQVVQYPERYFTEAEWQALRTTAEMAVSTIVNKMITLRILFPNEDTVANFSAVGQWAQRDNTMNDAIWWRDSIKSNLKTLRKTVPPSQQFIKVYPEDPRALAEVDSVLFNSGFLAAPAVDPPDDLFPDALPIMKSAMPRRVSNQLTGNKGPRRAPAVARARPLGYQDSPPSYQDSPPGYQLAPLGYQDSPPGYHVDGAVAGSAGAQRSAEAPPFQGPALMPPPQGAVPGPVAGPAAAPVPIMPPMAAGPSAGAEAAAGALAPGDAAAAAVDQMLDEMGKKGGKSASKGKTSDTGRPVLKRPAAASAGPAKKKPAAAGPSTPAKSGSVPEPSSRGKLKVPAYPGAGYFEPMSCGEATIHCSHDKNLWRVKPEKASRDDKEFAWGSRDPREAWKLVQKHLRDLANAK